MKFFNKLLEKILLAFIPVTIVEDDRGVIRYYSQGGCYVDLSRTPGSIWVRENPEKAQELIRKKMEKK